ncbi:unnamed protein product, partial [Prorocentrum cordatum]
MLAALLAWATLRAVWAPWAAAPAASAAPGAAAGTAPAPRVRAVAPAGLPTTVSNTHQPYSLLPPDQSCASYQLADVLSEDECFGYAVQHHQVGLGDKTTIGKPAWDGMSFYGCVYNIPNPTIGKPTWDDRSFYGCAYNIPADLVMFNDQSPNPSFTSQEHKYICIGVLTSSSETSSTVTSTGTTITGTTSTSESSITAITVSNTHQAYSLLPPDQSCASYKLADVLSEDECFGDAVQHHRVGLGDKTTIGKPAWDGMSFYGCVYNIPNDLVMFNDQSPTPSYTATFLQNICLGVATITTLQDSNCPDNSTGHSVGHGCVCDAGYSGSIWPARDYPFYNGSCIAVNCPEHSTGVSVPDNCTCEPGYMGAIRPASEAPFYNGSCVAVECPAGSSGTSVANGCVCNPGYSGTWTCEAGYSDAITATTIEPYYSGSCEAVNCPGNSTGSSVADGCACNAGFEGVINPISEPPFYSGTCTVLECSAAPTHAPTALPTYSPTSAPTVSPTASPTLVPTFLPTPAPTHLPGVPTPPPTVAPTFAPTSAPTPAPTLLPCANFDEAGTSYPCKCGTATCNQDELCYFASSTCVPACSNIDATGSADLFDTTVGRCGCGANICTTTNSSYCHKESNRCIACSSEGTCDDVVYVCEGFEVRSHAWQGCANLRNAVIPSSIYLIGEFAFADSSLQSVSIPEGALIIRNSAFENTSLTEVRLPSTLRAVFDRAFWSNSYLRHVTMFFPKPSWGQLAFPADVNITYANGNCSRGEILTSDGCSQCEPHEIPNQGQDECVACEAGKMPHSSSSYCKDCDAGKYSAGDSVCQLCQAGTISGIGDAACMPCSVGKIPNRGGSACENCSAGKYWAGDGQCQVCETGRISNQGSITCEDCPPGKMSSSSASSCKDCAAGKYSFGDTLCQECEGGTVSEQGSSNCKACPGDLQPTNSRSSCVCPAGTMLVGSSTCEPCPQGGVCVDGVVVSAISRHWLPAGDNAMPVKCPLGERDGACLEDNNCSNGYTGSACAICADGFGRSDSRCVPCTGAGIRFYIVMAVFAAIAIIWPALREFGPDASQILNFADPDQSAIEVSTGDLADSFAVSITVASHASRVSQSVAGAASRLEKLLTSHAMRVVKVQGRILFLFLQASSGWIVTLYATFPHILDSNFDAFHTVVTSCTSWVHAVVNSDMQLRFGCVVLPDAAFVMKVAALPIFLTIYFFSDRLCKLIANMTCLQSTIREHSYGHGIGERLVLPYFWLTYLSYTPLTLAIVSHMPIKGGAFDCTLEAYNGGECY